MYNHNKHIENLNTIADLRKRLNLDPKQLKNRATGWSQSRYRAITRWRRLLESVESKP